MSDIADSVPQVAVRPKDALRSSVDNVNPRKPQDVDWRSAKWDEHTHTVTLDEGEQLSYVDIGAGEGPGLLLVHGLGASWRVWLENLLPLAATHRVVAVDLPGFGASPPEATVITYDAFARTLDRLCRKVGLTSVVVIGNSFGGWVAAELALRQPDLVAGLVLVDAAGIPATPRERLKVVGMLRMADRVAPAICRRRELLASRPKLRRRVFASLVARADLLPGDLAIHLVPETPSPVFRLVLEAAVKSWSSSWCERVAQLDVPALIIWGERDRQLPLRHAYEWARLLRRSTLVVVDGAGHLPMLENPAAVNAAILRFLSAESLYHRENV
jgi:pimeloyl-ACP methyl ester carboxylesterase